MTTPPPEGGGFSGSYRCLTAQSEPKDVLCSIGVGVRGVSAPLAPERFTIAVSGSDMSADMTGARSVAGVDFDDFDNSFFRFLPDQFKQHPPTRVEDAPVETGFLGDVRTWFVGGSRRRAGHVPDLEVFDNDHVVGIDVGSGDLVQMIFPNVFDLAVQDCEAGDGLPSPMRLPFLVSEVALGLSESFLRGLEWSDVVHKPAVAVGNKMRDATIQADNSVSEWLGLDRYVNTGGVDVPMLALPGDGELLDCSAHRPVHLHLDAADTLNADGIAEPLTSVAVDECDGVEAPGRPEARVAGFLALLDAGEERGERFVQSAQRLLLGRERPAALPERIGVANVLQLVGLHPVADRRSTHPEGVTTLLEGGVVEVAVIAEHRLKHDNLAAGRVKAVAEGAVHPIASIQEWRN